MFSDRDWKNTIFNAEITLYSVLYFSYRWLLYIEVGWQSLCKKMYYYAGYDMFACILLYYEINFAATNENIEMSTIMNFT